VGTKRQAQDAVAEEAKRCGMYYVNQRWLGGLLTNMLTVQKSIKRLKTLDVMATTGDWEGRPKKEIIRLERERKHLQQNLEGIKDMGRLPDVVFVIDSSKEAIAGQGSAQAWHSRGGRRGHQLRPGRGELCHPGNDDALRAIRLFTNKVADAVIEGKALATEQEFAAEKIISDETPPEEIPEYTQYVDPRYAEQLMAESIPTRTCPPCRCRGESPPVVAPEAAPNAEQ